MDSPTCYSCIILGERDEFQLCESEIQDSWFTTRMWEYEESMRLRESRFSPIVLGPLYIEGIRLILFPFFLLDVIRSNLWSQIFGWVGVYTEKNKNE
jgi:hypothetical protein